MNKKLFNVIISLLFIFSLALSTNAEEKRYYLGNTINTGKDTGYSENHEINNKDPHWNWTLGNFYVSGFSDVIEGKNPVFLKTVGE